MLNPNTMTPEQEQLARAQAFYLLKKFTSFTFLDKARSLYQGLLDAYTVLLNQPVYQPLTPGYKALLEYMVPIEEGLNLLRKSPHKLEAYQRLENCTAPISDYFFGRGAHEMGISYQPFYQSLGMVEEDSGKPNTGAIADVIEMGEMMDCLERSIFDRTMLNPITPRISEWPIVMAYNYVTMFAEPYYRAAPGYKRPYPKYIAYPLRFPNPLPPCPGHNTSKDGQIWSGEQIQVHGIYEPWLNNGKVGCPNYFLAGQEAIEYQMEGTEDQPKGSDNKEAVRWRLIWEDKRYLDGHIPAEEGFYLSDADVDASPPPVDAIFAMPSQPCPKEGWWHAPHLQMKQVYMLQGEPMPAEQYGPTGGVIWYYMTEQRPRG